MVWSSSYINLQGQNACPAQDLGLYTPQAQPLSGQVSSLIADWGLPAAFFVLK